MSATTLGLLARLRRLGVRARLTAAGVEYDDPSAVLSPDLRRELVEREREVADMLRAVAPPDRRPTSSTGTGSTPGASPVTFAQQRLWFLDRLAPGSAVYHVALAFRLRGPLNDHALGCALSDLVSRHEALRTTFTTVGGELRQVVGPPREVVLEVVSPSGEERARGEQAWFARAAALVSRPIDLASDLLLRAALMRLAPDDAVLVLTVHHIAVDADSITILLRELSLLYRAHALGRQMPALPTQVMSVADFARSQRAHATGEALDPRLAAIVQRLGELPEVELPADRPRRREPSWRGAKARFSVPEVTCRRLREFCRRRQVTPFATLLATLSVVLHRWTHQRRLVLGIPVSARSHPDLGGVVGLFVNTAVIVSDVSDAPAFELHVDRTQAATRDALADGDVPFERLVETLRPHRDLSRNPLFQVMYDHVYSPPPRLELEALDVEQVLFDSKVARLDMAVQTLEHGDRFGGWVEYSLDLFDSERIGRLIDHFLRVLEGAVAAPDTAVEELPLLGPQERDRVLVGWNRSAAAYPRDAAVEELFSAHVGRAPDAVAVEQRGVTMTYAELDARSTCFAAGLAVRGARAGDVVALGLDRSPELVIAMLGVLKAGAVYLPIGADEAPVRAARIIGETGPRLLVGPPDRADVLRALGPPVATVAQIEAQGRGTAARPPARAGGERIASVMYTSGSTGEPKGIAIGHRGIVRLVVAPTYVRLGSQDRVAHMANPAFDAATFEVWGALANGGRVVIVDRHEVLQPARLAARLRESGVTVAFVTTALLNEVALLAPEAFSSLEYLLFGGETAAPDRVRRVLAEGPPRHLVHVYGPTECTTFATAGLVTGVAEHATTVPIGVAIGGTSCYVLDDRLRPVPIGVDGELYLGGDGVAIGYVNQPVKNAERFVPDPFDTDSNARLFRTGDLVRWREDGRLDFIGRRDDQIKLRGFRVEPREVELALCQHPKVQSATVAPRLRDGAVDALVAYVVSAPGAAPAPEELREFLAERLPPYMIPAVFVPLASLPFDASGKIDRRALPPPPAAAPAGGDDGTPLEREIAAILADLLDVPALGVEADFFVNGGHSLLSARALARLRGELGLPLLLRDLFMAPTARSLAVLATTRSLASLDERRREELLRSSEFEADGGSG